MNDLEQQLLDNLTRSAGGCWLWTGRTMHKGYGVIGKARGRTIRVHRLAYELHCGPIPKGLMVCHRCDVRTCCNPVHLFLGTATDNNRDMYGKGRASDRRGEKHGAAKLTAADVACIRASADSASSQARRYGVSHTQIRRIRQGERWSHVP